MTDSQLSQTVIDHTRDISALYEQTKSLGKRIDENDTVTKGIHELARQIATIAVEIKSLARSFDSSIERVESGQKSPGERIGNIERTLISMERHEKELEKHTQRIEAIEKEPAGKWKTLVAQITALIVAALVGLVVSRMW
jgi:predicted  nucleic acid-binding Zn-ribbon protein